MRSASRLLSVHTIDDAVARQRQNRERPGRQEMLLGAAVVLALMRHGGDDGRLIVIPAMRDDAGLLADLRARAVGADQQPRRHRLAIRQASRRCACGACSKPLDRGGAQIDAEFLRLRHQRIDQIAVLDHVRERLARLRLRRRSSGRSAAPRRRAWNRSPPCRGSAAPSAATASQTPMRLEQPPRGGRDRRGARVLRRHHGQAPDRRPSP